jgi:DNA-damage-inducible protein J
MNTTSLHVKIEPEIKRDAEKVADELGLSLSAVTKVLLKQFIRTRKLSVELVDRPEIPNDATRRALAQADEDIAAGRGMSFANVDEAIAYLDKEIANEKKSAH